MFKFVNSDTTGPAPKRLQSQRACEPCRKRKRRCHHYTAGANNGRPPPSKSSSDAVPLTSREYSTAQASPPSLYPGDARGIEYPDPSIQRNTASHVSVAHGSSAALPSEGESGVQEIHPLGDTGEHRQPTHEDDSSKHPKNLGSRFIGDLSPEGILLAATSPDTTRGSSSM